MKNKYRVTLVDGTILDELTLNGNNFVADYEIDKSVFDGNLSSVTIFDGENEHTHTNMELIRFVIKENKTWFVIRDISAAKLEKLKMQSDIEYMAMMTGVEL